MHVPRESKRMGRRLDLQALVTYQLINELFDISNSKLNSVNKILSNGMLRTVNYRIDRKNHALCLDADCS